MNKADIIKAIRESPLTTDDMTEIIGAATSVMMGNMFVDAGMSLLQGESDDEEAEAQQG
jgi:hypothetical protein